MVSLHFLLIALVSSHEIPGPACLEIEERQIVGVPSSDCRPKVPGVIEDTVAFLQNRLSMNIDKATNLIESTDDVDWPMYHEERPDGLFGIHNGTNGCYMLTDWNAKDHHAIAKLDYERPELTEWEFAFGECPQVLRSAYTKRLFLGTESVPYQGNASTWNGFVANRNATFHPAIIRLPERFRAGSLSSGYWLVVRKFSAKVFILDRDFEIIKEIPLVVSAGPPWLPADGDLRMFETTGGEIFITFMPYNLELDTSALKYSLVPSGDTWFLHQVVGQLQLEAEGNELIAVVNASDVHAVAECTDQDLKAPGPKKNMGFFQSPHEGTLYLLDWAYPPKAGKVRWDEPKRTWPVPGRDAPALDIGMPKILTSNLPPPVQRTTAMCYGHESPVHELTNPPFGKAERTDGSDEELRYPSNSVNLVWVEEIQKHVGISHIHRGFGDKKVADRLGDIPEWSDFPPIIVAGHHYTQMLFAISPEPPFRTTHMSTEFCFASQRKPSDCEIIQFVTTFIRDGDEFIVGYGVMDSEGYVAKFSLQEILRLLRPVE